MLKPLPNEMMAELPDGGARRLRARGAPPARALRDELPGAACPALTRAARRGGRLDRRARGGRRAPCAAAAPWSCCCPAAASAAASRPLRGRRPPPRPGRAAARDRPRGRRRPRRRCPTTGPAPRPRALRAPRRRLGRRAWSATACARSTAPRWSVDGRARGRHLLHGRPGRPARGAARRARRAAPRPRPARPAAARATPACWAPATTCRAARSRRRRAPTTATPSTSRFIAADVRQDPPRRRRGRARRPAPQGVDAAVPPAHAGARRGRGAHRLPARTARSTPSSPAGWASSSTALLARIRSAPGARVMSVGRLVRAARAPGGTPPFDFDDGVDCAAPAPRARDRRRGAVRRGGRRLRRPRACPCRSRGRRWTSATSWPCRAWSTSPTPTIDAFRISPGDRRRARHAAP